MNESQTGAAASQPPAWGAVVSMGLGIFGLVTAEFLPASLLTPMAGDLAVTEGMAGQAVTATAVVAFFTSLLLASVIRNIDRRHVLLTLSALLVASNLLAAFAPNLTILLIARVFLGVALGGFWTMSTAIAMRLVPEKSVPRALSIIVAGVSGATIFAAPVGSFLGAVIGWRNVFILAAGLGLLAFVVQFATLPKMPPRGRASIKTIGVLLARPSVSFGLLAATLVFGGHFALFTYLRPFLETVTLVDINTISAILLGFGIANIAGTFLGGFLVERSLRLTLIAAPLTMTVLGAGLLLSGTMAFPTAILAAAWGLAFGTVPVAWSSWLARTTPDEAETAGGLLVASINFAIASGAAAGGAIYDTSGAPNVLASATAILLLAALFITLSIRPRPAMAAA
ncbi:MFS transporter [Pelagibacterium xiamenense]|uniref:MFS transporter n=1 Tax=Pelagibacterium xiamenense TaxID=2901140 RepID=UPI001E3696CC|nr:MFS transporter [Pelagibacterium xiamenense]MCD7060271.1 MFS transporter [Pelagibacterium xiamenense]